MRGTGRVFGCQTPFCQVVSYSDRRFLSIQEPGIRRLRRSEYSSLCPLSCSSAEGAIFTAFVPSRDLHSQCCTVPARNIFGQQGDGLPNFGWFHIRHDIGHCCSSHNSRQYCESPMAVTCVFTRYRTFADTPKIFANKKIHG